MLVWVHWGYNPVTNPLLTFLRHPSGKRLEFQVSDAEVFCRVNRGVHLGNEKHLITVYTLHEILVV